MFTGLVCERGRLVKDPVPSGTGGVELTLGHSRELGERLAVGDSLAVSGVCLTLTEHSPRQSKVDLSPETLARTVLGDLREGAAVNLEPALRMGDALGGHWVQGHVDTTTDVLTRKGFGGASRNRFRSTHKLSSPSGTQGVGDGRWRQPDDRWPRRGIFLDSPDSPHFRRHYLGELGPWRPRAFGVRRVGEICAAGFGDGGGGPLRSP